MLVVIHMLQNSFEVFGATFLVLTLKIHTNHRARKPQAAEKEALNIAFLASPIVSILGPALLTNDVVVLWCLNAVVVLLSYVYAYTTYTTYSPNSTNIDSTTNTTYTDGDSSSDNVETSTRESVVPKWLRCALKALDYGSGQERGLRK